MFNLFNRKTDPKQHFELNLPEVGTEPHSEIASPHPGTKPEAVFIIPKKPLLSAENIALMAIILLILSLGSGMWLWSRVRSMEKVRQADSQRHEMVLDSLSQVKITLENNLDQLESSFTDLSAGKDSLAQQLTTATNIIAEKEIAIRDIRNQKIREETALRSQIQRLQTIKDRYETVIAVLYQKNAALSAENAYLRGTADSLSTQISELGRQLEAQIRQTLSAQYKATAFRVELIRRNDKMTVRARRTRELKISFDLYNVPQSYQGNQQLYLAITDDKGLPVSSDNPIRAMIKTDKGNVEIIAQSARLQNIIADQRIGFNYKLDDRLQKGTYIVAVYSEKGLLGVASFRLS